MDLRQLEYFVAVVEEANFTRAAARVHVSQPGISAQIRQLEHELGQPLLDRSGRRVRVTKVGEAVLPFARAALAAAGNARRAVDELTGILRGRAAVGMLSNCPMLDLPKLLAEFHRRYPAVEVSLSEANSDQLVQALAEGRLDLALIGSAGEPRPGLATQVIVDERLVAAVGRSDSWAGRSSVTLEQLQERELISLPKGTGIRTCLDAACADEGLRMRIAFEASNPGILSQLASRGLGVAILAESMARGRPGELQAIAISRPRLRSRIELAWRAGGPVAPAAKALIDLARAMLGPRGTAPKSARPAGE